ncbi:hypothetical protein BWI97_15775 [Siphonobacter sp. BAB-5405]|uniref:hypothetical protein n=1 Tax=Siphonobacter sp. BAB-5405 TaxID=1864825 RepID=UPI000C8003CB|nr:hypothetical protein [Siphonobacter sp. BAB-5405]PMD94855.1 hypothetical protein BWI97_15775 [Siphonobacter sp. BAB-5405]
MKIGNIILLTGNFGIGKSSIIQGEGRQEGRFYVHSNGWQVLGDRNGADVALKNISKADLLNGLRNYPGNLIITGVYFQSHKDLDIYSKYHHLHVIFLRTSKANNRLRIKSRGGKWNEQTWAENHNSLLKLFDLCTRKRITRLVMDNDRPLDVVRAEFWQYLNSLGNENPGTT